MTSHFEQLGGGPVLRCIIDTFVDRVYDDAMIGFFFRKVDRVRLKQLEYEHAARLLGADIPYTGRTMAKAHQNHPIMGGQFNRRMVILQQVLQDFEVPAPIQTVWMAHTEQLRSAVVRGRPNECAMSDEIC